MNSRPGCSGGSPPAFWPTKLLIGHLLIPELRDSALRELSERGKYANELGPLLWYSGGVICFLLQVVTSVYRKMSPPTLTMAESNRVSDAVHLLQSVARHPETKMQFMKADIGSYLYPFLSSPDKTEPLEQLRFAALGAIDSLLKDRGQEEVINYLLAGEIVQKCLHSIAIGSDPSQIIATFIIQSIASDETGLRYICSSHERLRDVHCALEGMVTKDMEELSPRLLKNIINCYWNLAKDSRAKKELRTYFPSTLRDDTILARLEDDPQTKINLQLLLCILR